MKRYYIHQSSWFDSHRYDSNKMKRIVKENGGKYVRLSRAYGWSNQPKVVGFNATPGNLKKIEKALEQEITPHIIIHEQDW